MPNIPYDKTQNKSKYGHYDDENKAGYVITDPNGINGSWFYIYDNREILLYVDQNGPVKVQYQPPNGILVFKREMGENQSKWQVWVSSSSINGGVPVSSFGSPELNCTGEKPEREVRWTPEKATYISKYKNATIQTEICVPFDTATICMKTKVTNHGERAEFTVNPAMFPYVNIPQMVAWDLPEWYLTSTIRKQKNTIAFCGQMKEPNIDASKNRSITLSVDYEANAGIETDMTAFTGVGNFFSPVSVKEGLPLRYKMEDSDGIVQSSYQAVYTAKYSFTLEKGQSKTITQVLTVQKDTAFNQKELDADIVYFDDAGYQKRLQDTKAFYLGMFEKRTVNTANPIYNNFINNFAPLQMHWVSTLDRGWPSQQRGIRDSSQDCMGLLHINPQEVRKKIIELFTHQTKEGWFYKQMSTVSRSAPHDMRKFCDGGAFVLELVHEYLAFTKDDSVLFEQTCWLDSDENSSILEHVISCIQFYIDQENIGEHGLCKAWHGDWYDIIDQIGTDGRGESVTVTAQNIINLANMAKIIKWLNGKGKATQYADKIAEYEKHVQSFKTAMNTYALNSDGYYNGYFNDNGEWLLGNSDPDGQKKVYIVANAWAILSGAPDNDTSRAILEIIDKNNMCTVGYKLVDKPFAKYVEKAGRMGSLLLNGATPYNHGTCFLIRACCAAGNAEMAYKASRYILPIEEEYAPSDMTFAPPFTIANSYSCNEKFLHRVELQYLSGTVSYVLRTFYSSFCGINYELDGLTLKPCLPNAFGDFSVQLDYHGKNFKINYIQKGEESIKFTFNGKPVVGQINAQSGKNTAFFSDEIFEDKNVIDVYY